MSIGAAPTLLADIHNQLVVDPTFVEGQEPATIIIYGVDVRHDLVRDANGAFLRLGAMSLTTPRLRTMRLNAGTIDDVTGESSFAVGRWTAATYTDIYGSTKTLTANQGLHYIIYDQVPFDLAIHEPYLCRMVHATKPTATSVDVAPGTVSANLQINPLGPNAIFSMSLSLGQDKSYMIEPTPLNGFSIWGGSNVATMTSIDGNKASVNFVPIRLEDKVLTLGLGYAVTLPKSGNVNGVAIMKCEPKTP
ncbi:MAG: hypothetical protein QM803_09850 [Rhodocyclaceae bacterium]